MGPEKRMGWKQGQKRHLRDQRPRRWFRVFITFGSCHHGRRPVVTGSAATSTSTGNTGETEQGKGTRCWDFTTP